jgi:hypothetical protein
MERLSGIRLAVPVLIVVLAIWFETARRWISLP